MQQAHVPKYIPSGSAAHILDIGRAVRLLSQPPDSLNPFNASSSSSQNSSASFNAWPQLGGPRAGHPPTSTAGERTHPYPGGAKGGDSQAGVVQLDLVALSAGLQKLAEMPKFSGIAFETTITDLHEQV